MSRKKEKIIPMTKSYAEDIGEMFEQAGCVVKIETCGKRKVPGTDEKRAQVIVRGLKDDLS